MQEGSLSLMQMEKKLFYMIIKKTKIYVAILPSPTTTTGGVRASFAMLGAQLRWHFGG